MQRVLAERRKRTEGAVEAAESAVAQAAEKMAAYEKALAEARAGIYAGQEENRKRLGTEQAAAVEAARGKAAAQVAAARVEIAAEAEAARAGLAAESDRLAEQIAQAVLAGKN
jgi:F0F1-type ATP synthase membrane subunit b/b'